MKPRESREDLALQKVVAAEAADEIRADIEAARMMGDWYDDLTLHYGRPNIDILGERGTR